MKLNSWLIAFIVVAILELLSTILMLNNLHLVAKPLLMVMLAGYFLSICKGKKSNFKILVVVALSFSWLGDVLLMFQQNAILFFLLGLISFLIAHIFYTYTFLKSSDRRMFSKTDLLIGALMLLHGGVLYYYLWSGLGDMSIPVFVYMLVILSMGWSALYRKAKGYRYVLTGALLFIISDSILAFSKFHSALL